MLPEQHLHLSQFRGRWRRFRSACAVPSVRCKSHLFCSHSFFYAELVMSESCLSCASSCAVNGINLIPLLKIENAISLTIPRLSVCPLRSKKADKSHIQEAITFRHLTNIVSNPIFLKKKQIHLKCKKKKIIHGYISMSALTKAAQMQNPARIIYAKFQHSFHSFS